MTGREVINATKAAVGLLGNASAHVTHARRTKVTLDLNKALLNPLIEEDSNFVDATPALFGAEFAQKSKVLQKAPPPISTRDKISRRGQHRNPSRRRQYSSKCYYKSER